MEMCINQLPTNLRPGQASHLPMDRRLVRLQDLDWTLRQTHCVCQPYPARILVTLLTELPKLTPQTQSSVNYKEFN
jgi:hypothetical protein